ncbi:MULTISPECIES: PRC-barrel domain-containing protein [unclassified Streptomyces]|uniref:PRC-barrel domain-containing protein n=1 Tax=unclassified Streptomyces TaxID=2593676 RepID=UPI0022AFD22A|nr:MULTISPECIES: PRC-barrel domain-containing protein [unclassified Streptomyces]MCZ4119239.1 PRC-barrel domain-containing protein [Streptomyces sp. H39-S7]MDF9816643.1 sporulation protein YlmC with PRC-barrel domain [Streptomyces sp. SPB162]
MMLLSELSGLTVMSKADAVAIGTVAGIVIDPAASRVIALHLAKTSGAGKFLAWPDVHAVGPDAVMAPDGGALRDADDELAPLATASSGLLGKRLLTDHGEEDGIVQDIDFDPRTGSVSALLTSGGNIPGTRLIGIGSYAAVVRTP